MLANQEDSLVVSKSAIDRGLLQLSAIHTISDTNMPSESSAEDTFCVPPLSSAMGIKPDEEGYFKRKVGANYSALDENGFVRKGTRVFAGDVVIGKITTSTSKNGITIMKDCSKVLQSDEGGVVDRVDVFSSPSGYKTVNVVISTLRNAIVGNKLASREGQKGTIGATIRQEDLPFTAEGIVPDIIMNANALPSRMTISQIIESAFGKACTINGKYGDCSPFTDQSKTIGDLAKDLLHKSRYPKSGMERLYSGYTGEMIESSVCIGVTVYYALKHMVEDKAHARKTGKYVADTRQPVEGRNRDGGIRFGEMERDCILARGMAGFLEERLCKVSDPFNIPVCVSCKNIANSKECSYCGSAKIERYNMPYASKLLLQLLKGFGLKISVE